MIRRLLDVLLLLLGLCLPAIAEEMPECRPLQAGRVEYDGPSRFDKGVLWEIRAPNGNASHLFGTIHVADEEIVNLPAPVSKSLAASRTFVMEVVPEQDEIMEMASMMYVSDGEKLDALISPPLYQRVVEILSAYNVPEMAVASMRPWSAYLTMSYPADMRPVLDLRLLEQAEAAGMETHGLETLVEQGHIFSDLPVADQVRLLADTACHHELLSEDMEAMKRLYLARNLKGMFVYGQRQAFADNKLYEQLADRLLFRRNGVMTERMQPYLEQGGAFIAVGAMHLPGKEGILNRLARLGYRMNRVY